MVITCSRCGQRKEAVIKPAFYTGTVGELLKQNACTDCWQEWIRMQIMIVNEYKLDLMDPKTDEFLNQQVLLFFNLGGSATKAKVEYAPPGSPG